MSRSAKFVLTLLAILSPIAPATAGWEPSQAELRALPPYCAARFHADADTLRTWKASMGPDFIHIHHYCAGLNFMNRARRSFSPGRQDTLVAAVREFDYMLDHVAADFYLRPEILMNRGITLALLKRNGEAVGNLLKAIELDPGQARAYMTLADLYLKQKNRDKALDTVTEGLRHNPGTKSLQRRYTELGGKLPYPAAIEPAAAEARAATPDAPPVAEAAPAGEPAAQPEASAAAAAAPVGAPKIGSPTNPYCRFCPD